MKKYKLFRETVLVSVLSLVLTTSGCGEKIDDNLKNKYVAVVDGKVRLLEEEKTIGGDFFRYNDIITGEEYDKFSELFENVEIKGSLVQFLSAEQINVINQDDIKGDGFSDEDWIEFYNSICNKYRKKWNLDIDNEKFSDYDVEAFLDDYNSLIDSDNFYILDTSLCDINNNSDYELERYYLIIKNDNPINNYYGDEERLLFENKFNGFYLWYDGDAHLENGDKSIYLSSRDEVQALFNINDFFDKEGIDNRKNKYSVLELEEIMEVLNQSEIEKIASDRVYVFDATRSNIDIVAYSADSDISSLMIDDYYILIKDNSSNIFDTLSNSDGSFLYSGIYLSDNNILRSSAKDFMFVSDVDFSSNLMNINEFLRVNGLEEYILDEYSNGELNKINFALNKIGLKNVKRRILK